MKQFLKSFAVGTIAFVAAVGVIAGIFYGTTALVRHVYKAEIAAAKEQRDLDKYICDKHKGKVYILTAEDGSKERVCLTSEGIVR